MKHIIDLIFPKLCMSCRQENHVKKGVFCVSCLQKLSFTDQFDQGENAFLRRFYGRVKLRHAAAMFWYTKGDIVQKLVYGIKYNNQKEVGYALGKLMAEKISDSKSFGLIDLIVPVPLHPLKKLKRGFNQSELLAIAISKELNIPYKSKVILKKDNTISQTHKSRLERLIDIEGAFVLNPKYDIRGHNILLVDDVLTTGATLESCANELLKVEIASLSMLTIAMGRL